MFYLFDQMNAGMLSVKDFVKTFKKTLLMYISHSEKRIIYKIWKDTTNITKCYFFNPTN